MLSLLHLSLACFKAWTFLQHPALDSGVMVADVLTNRCKSMTDTTSELSFNVIGYHVRGVAHAMILVMLSSEIHVKTSLHLTCARAMLQTKLHMR